MATREEIADILAGFALFGDLQTPQLLGVASIFDEVVFPEDERILRQGLTGSGFFVILDGDADVRIDGQRAGDARPRRLLRRGLDPARRAADGRRRGDARRCAASSIAGTDVAGVPASRHPQVMYRMLQAQARRLRNANRWRS